MTDTAVLFHAAQIISQAISEYRQLTGLLIDDKGNCIHAIVTTKEPITIDSIKRLGEEFGDNDPNVYAEGSDMFRIVITNDKHDEITLKSNSIQGNFDVPTDV